MALPCGRIPRLTREFSSFNFPGSVSLAARARRCRRSCRASVGHRSSTTRSLCGYSLARLSGRDWGGCMRRSCACACQLEQVVGGADERPFASGVVETSEEELSEASGLLDLAEDGLDDLLSQAV